MRADAPVVIIGAGHAGVQAAASLREEGFNDRILLLSGEEHLPYQRPPLSKAFMTKEKMGDALLLRGPAFYTDQRIELALGEAVEAIDRAQREVVLRSGGRLSYRHLIIATGSRVRDIPLPGAELDGVLRLRNLDDACLIREHLSSAAQVVVIGAGFIGLEFAATAVKAGAQVHVVESASRVMARAVSENISNFFRQAHGDFGCTIHFGCQVERIEGDRGRVTGVVLSEGRRLPADLVLVGIGTLALDEIAREAGLDCRNGISVDVGLTSSDETISAIGDCALHFNSFAADTTRLESVQNAVDQARVVARKLVGRTASYASLPWFWSDQGDLKLQMAGLVGGCDSSVLRGAPASRCFSVFSFKSGILRCVETVNRPGDHMAARRLIGEGVSITPQQAADSAFDIKSLFAGTPSREAVSRSAI